jgi:hypothetical protein
MSGPLRPLLLKQPHAAHPAAGAWLAAAVPAPAKASNRGMHATHIVSVLVPHPVLVLLVGAPMIDHNVSHGPAGTEWGGSGAEAGRHTHKQETRSVQGQTQAHGWAGRHSKSGRHGRPSRHSVGLQAPHLMPASSSALVRDSSSCWLPYLEFRL